MKVMTIKWLGQYRAMITRLVDSNMHRLTSFENGLAAYW